MGRRKTDQIIPQTSSPMECRIRQERKDNAGESNMSIRPILKEEHFKKGFLGNPLAEDSTNKHNQFFRLSLVPYLYRHFPHRL